MRQLKKRVPGILCIVLCFCIVSGCYSQRYTPSDFSGKQLIFGSGGGFTRQVTQYTLLENGQLFITNTLTKETKELKKINKKEAQKLFEKATEFGINTLKFNHPGNMYYFVRLKEGSTVQGITWGSTEHQIPQDIQEFYQYLLNTLTNN